MGLDWVTFWVKVFWSLGFTFLCPLPLKLPNQLSRYHPAKRRVNTFQLAGLDAILDSATMDANASGEFAD